MIKSVGILAALLRTSLICVLLTLMVSCGQSEYLDQAREVLADADLQEQAFQDAQAVGNGEEAARIFSDVRTLRRQARDLYFLGHADNSSDIAVLEEFAALCERTEDYDLAGHAYRRAAQQEPDSAEYYLHAGLNFVRAGEGLSEEAHNALQKAYELAQANEQEALMARASEGLGHIFQAKGFFDIAKRHYESALAVDAALVEARFAMAGIAIRNGRVEDAIGFIESTPIQDQRQAIFLERMMREGYDRFRANRVTFEDTSANHFAYAKLLIRLGLHSDSLLAAERCVELDDQNQFAWNLVGSLARQAGRNDRAREAFQRSLAIDPNQPRTREALGTVSEA